jgi:hypothetical protein
MLRSHGDDEFDLIRKQNHIKLVTSEINLTFPKYFASMIEDVSRDGGMEQLAQKFRVKKAKSDAPACLREALRSVLKGYEEEKAKYQEVFNDESMQEYREDPDAFKGHLAKKCPVIRRSLGSQRSEMREWQQKFKYTPAVELTDTFVNLQDFAQEYIDATDPKEYRRFDRCAEFKLGKLQDDEDFYVLGVIGMGIKSAVLYHQDPRLFARRGRMDLYGLYFLSNEKDFGLPSGTSEFLMINDLREASETHNLKMDQNYWYPYDLFSLYALRLYRLLSDSCKALGIQLDNNHLYVYVVVFLEHVCRINHDAIEVMLGGLQE